MNMLVKRHFAVVTAILIVVGTFITGDIKVIAASGDTTVYITKTGEKYHADGCRSLSKSKIETTLQSAVDRGYEACKVCKPPKLNAASATTATQTNAATDAVEALKTYKGNTKDFNAYTYYINNTDLQTAVGADGDKLLKHYNDFGKTEGRIAK